MNRFNSVYAITLSVLALVGCVDEETTAARDADQPEIDCRDASKVCSEGLSCVQNAAAWTCQPAVDAGEPELDSGRQLSEDAGEGEQHPCGEAGDCGAGDAGLIDFEDAGEAYLYTHIVVVDTSVDENSTGTAGADICGIAVVCGDTALIGSVSSYLSGTGGVCLEQNVTCGTDRSDSAAVEDDGRQCDASSAPSDYMSLGMGGWISVEFNSALDGCEVTVSELQGRDEEGFDVYACNGDSYTRRNAEACVLIGSSDGGEFLGAIPAE